MIPYIIFYIIILALTFKIKEKKFEIWDFILLGVLISFSAFRTVGVDYNLYKLNFEHLTLSSSITSRTGIAYAYFAYFVKFVLKNDFQIIIIVISLITNIFIYLFFKKNSKRPGMSLLIYISLGFYTTSFNMFRQMLSFAIVLHGLNKFNEKKYLKMIVLYCLAFFIHSSSIIAIIMYTFFSKFPKIEINKILLFSLSIFGLIFYNKLFPLVVKLTNGYEMYLNYDATPGIGTFMIVGTFLIIYFFMFLLNKKKIIDFEQSNTFLNLLTIGIAIMILELKNFLFFRFAFYFTFFISIIFVDYYESCNLKKNKFLNLAFYLCMFIYFLVYINNFDGVVPYNWIFG